MWQADYITGQSSETVTYVDWGDNVEAVNPRVGRPFRLEVVLFKALDTPMTAYTMAPLEYPQSSSELQGTNTTTYESPFATVISAKPKIVIQYLGAAVPTLTWNGTAWATSDATIPTIVPVNFVPELNVGGKYIYGASMGGRWPSQTGYYRVTFYVPAESGVNLAGEALKQVIPGYRKRPQGGPPGVMS